MEKFSFEIATPCHENWDRMTPETQGRFCASCQKCVVDLSDKKPAEMKALYDAHEGNMCGRVRVSQLARQPRRIFPKIQVPVAALARVQRFALALLLVGGLIFGLPGKAAAQTPDRPEPVKMGMMVYVPSNSVQGVVRDEDGKPMPNVRVWLMDEAGNRIVSTDANANGEYILEGQWFGEFRLQAAVPGYYGGDATINFTRDTELLVDLSLEEMRIMGGIGAVDHRLEPKEIKRKDREAQREYRRASENGADDDDAYYEDEEHANDLNIGDVDDVRYEDTFEAGMLADLVRDSILKTLMMDVATDTANTFVHEELPATVAEAGEKTQMELDGFQFTVYPNPSHDRVYVTAGSTSVCDMHIRLHDLEGGLLQEISWKPSLQPVQVIEIGPYANGVYLLTVNGKDGAGESTRVVKQ